MTSITLLTQMFPPETGAAANRAQRLVNFLARKKIAVTVITGFPHYPKRVLSAEYKGKFYQAETYSPADSASAVSGAAESASNVSADIAASMSGAVESKSTVSAASAAYAADSAKVKRFKSLIAKSKKARMVAEAWLGFATLLTGLFSPKTDYVYASTPSVMLGYAGFLLAKLKGSDLILEIRDLIWNYAFINDQGRLSLIGRLIQNSVLKIAARSQIVVVTNQIQKSFLIEHGIPEKLILIIYNGFTAADIRPITPKEREDHSLVVLYTGLVGIPQGLKILIDTAELTKDYDITYKIVGDGLEKEELMDLAARGNLRKVEFYPSVSKSELTAFYREADLLFVHLRGQKEYESALPSKVADYMLEGRPIIFAGRGEGKAIIEKADCGFTLEPNSPTELARVIINFCDEPRYEQGFRGYRYALQHFNTDELYQQLLDSSRRFTQTNPQRKCGSGKKIE